LNAFTSNEATVYQVNLPSNRLTQWAEVETDRFARPVFRLFQPEIETVYEEKNRSRDSKEYAIREAVHAALYEGHPYGRTILGSVEHLKRPSIQRMYDFVDKHYVPSNMAIVISGDIDAAQAIQVLDEHFSQWEPKDAPEAPTHRAEPVEGARRVSVQYPGEEYVLIAFRTVPNGHPDVETLALLDMILDNATAGLINLNLTQTQVVRAAGSSPLASNDYGAQYLWGVPKEGQTLAEVESLLLEQVELVKAGQFEDWIIPAIVTDFKKSEKAQLESNTARAGIMRSAFTEHAAWDYAVGQLDRMGARSKADVVRVANEYFGDDMVVGYRLDGEHGLAQLDKPALDPLDIDTTRTSAFARDILARPVADIEPVYVTEDDYEVIPYADGIDLYYSQNPINDLFTFSISVDKGRIHEERLGLAAMLLDKSGTVLFSADELSKQWYRIGSDFGFSPGSNASSFSLSGLDDKFEQSLALMMHTIRHPKAASDVLDELVQITLKNREDVQKDPRDLFGMLLQYSRYGDQSPYRRFIPTADLPSLTVDELHDHVESLLGLAHRIYYVGSLSSDDVLAALREYHPVRGGLEEPPAHVFLKARETAETEIYLVSKEAAQAQILIEFAGKEYDESLHTPVQFYNRYFSDGFSGIVMQELREARALAYQAQAQYSQGSRRRDQNVMYGYIATQADKTPEAIAAFLELFDALPESPDRFETVRQQVVNDYRTSRIGFRDVLGAVRSWELYELDGDPRKSRFEQAQTVQLADMMRFHADEIHGRPKRISIVGDKARIGMDAVAALGAVTELDPSDLIVE
ncbi:insulinase family protein, partial [Candidatus Poribacteria bacterium]|nr:insulinase family protein [Candidatus Poribacteria bacterium]